MSILLIDLRHYNQDKLFELAKIIKWHYKELVKYKEIGITKMWIDMENQKVIAYVTKDYNEFLLFGDDFEEFLLNMKSFKLPKKQKVLELDDILDKISKYGITSLKKDEKDFLNKLKE